MSAICGIFKLDGAPANPRVMEAMMAALQHRGPDGSGVILDGPVGLGHQMFHITPESLGEKLPFHKKDSGLIITAAIRPDNSDALFFSPWRTPIRPEYPGRPAGPSGLRKMGPKHAGSP